MPRRLHIQIQRLRSNRASEHIDVLLHAILAHAGAQAVHLDVDVEPSDEYCNIFIQVQKAATLWKRLEAFIAENPHEFEWLKKRWIVVLQGKSGWDDYLMLDHFDSSVKLDMAES